MLSAAARKVAVIREPAGDCCEELWTVPDSCKEPYCGLVFHPGSSRSCALPATAAAWGLDAYLEWRRVMYWVPFSVPLHWCDFAERTRFIQASGRRIIMGRMKAVIHVNFRSVRGRLGAVPTGLSRGVYFGPH